MKAKYLFKTNRLGFRLLGDEDVEYFAKLDIENKIEKFLPQVEQVERFASRISEFINQYVNKGLPCFAIFELETGEYAGSCGFSPFENKQIEVGYVFLKKCWGKGYATETLSGLLKWAKKNLEGDYIVGYTFAEHVASRRVMEKCGMKYYKMDTIQGVEYRFYHFKLG